MIDVHCIKCLLFVLAHLSVKAPPVDWARLVRRGPVDSARSVDRAPLSGLQKQCALRRAPPVSPWSTLDLCKLARLCQQTGPGQGYGGGRSRLETFAVSIEGGLDPELSLQKLRVVRVTVLSLLAAPAA